MDIPQLVKIEILKSDPKAEVVLFGSRARGDNKADSDWDFLVLLDGAPDNNQKESILEHLYDLELKTDSVISAIIYSKAEWEDRSITPLYQVIMEEGKRA